MYYFQVFTHIFRDTNVSDLWTTPGWITEVPLYHVSYPDMKSKQTSAEKDLGVVIDQNLKFHQHAAAVATKANRILGLISKCFKHLYVDSLPILYKTLVCPIFRICKFCMGVYNITGKKMLEKSAEESHQTYTFFEEVTLC